MNISQINFRPIKHSDLDQLCDLLWEPDVKKFLCDDEIIPCDTIQTFIDDSLTDKYSLLLVISHHQKWVGIVGLRPLEPKATQILDNDHPVEITVALTQQNTGKGIGKLAVQKIQNYAANTLNKQYIFAIIDMPNINSNYLFKSLAYKPLAELNIDKHPQILYQLPLKN